MYLVLQEKKRRRKGKAKKTWLHSVFTPHDPSTKHIYATIITIDIVNNINTIHTVALFLVRCVNTTYYIHSITLPQEHFGFI